MSTYMNRTAHLKSQSILCLTTHVQIHFSERKRATWQTYLSPFQTKILLTIFESSQLAHFLFFTAGITGSLYHDSFFLQGVSHREHSSRSAGMSKLYSKSCCQETKTSFRTSKATISYTVFRIWTTIHGTVLHWQQLVHTHFCVAQAYKGALCSHRMVCKICSECCPLSHCKSRHKNRFSSSAGFPLPIFKMMQSLTLILIAVIAVSVYYWFTLWSLPRQRQSLLWKV